MSGIYNKEQEEQWEVWEEQEDKDFSAGFINY